MSKVAAQTSIQHISFLDIRGATLHVPRRLQPKLTKMPKERPILRKSSNKKKPVRCIDTGEVYASSSEAADLLSGEGILVCPVRILSTCRGKQKSAGGLRWEYA